MEYYQLKEDYSTMQQQFMNTRNQSINTRNHSFSTRNIAPESGPLGKIVVLRLFDLKNIYQIILLLDDN